MFYERKTSCISLIKACWNTKQDAVKQEQWQRNKEWYLMQEKNLIKERRMKNCKATVGDKKNNN